MATPRLRGLLAVNAAVAAAGSMVFVNTVVMVQAGFGLPQSAVAIALASFGTGSILAALALPKVLERWADRYVMLTGVAVLVLAMWSGSLGPNYPNLLLTWFVVGMAYSTAQTPSGRLLRRSAAPVDRPALFAAQFVWSHVCWLVFYPLAGWAGAHWGMGITFTLLGLVAALALGVAWLVWPANDPDVLEHDHADGIHHAHPFWIDDQHPHWPKIKPRSDH